MQRFASQLAFLYTQSSAVSQITGLHSSSTKLLDAPLQQAGQLRSMAVSAFGLS